MDITLRLSIAKKAVEKKRQIDGAGWDYMYRSIISVIDLMTQAEAEGKLASEYRKQLRYGMVRIIQDDYVFADSELGLELADIAEVFEGHVD